MVRPAGRAKSDDRNRVRAYFAACPPNARRALRSMASAVRAVAPRAVDYFSYGIPGFRLDGRGLVSYAAWKKHTSMYPASLAFERELGKSASGLYFSGRGTIQFSLDKPVPVAIVKQLIKFRLKELKRRAK